MSGPERRDGATERRPQGDRPGPGGARPQGRDEGEGRRVGHAGGHAAEDPARPTRTSIVGAKAAKQAGRDRRRDAEDQHQLAAVPVAQRAEPQDRSGEAERVADRDEVQRGLRRVEVPGRSTAARRWRPTGCRFATAATRISERRTRPPLAGPPDAARVAAGCFVVGSMRTPTGPTTGLGRRGVGPTRTRSVGRPWWALARPATTALWDLRSAVVGRLRPPARAPETGEAPVGDRGFGVWRARRAG